MTTLLQPKQINITSMTGEEKTYIMHKFPAIQGREIIAKYPLSALPKVGDYTINEETMLKLMAFVTTDKGQPLSTKALIDNHVPDYETLIKIEMAMLEYNTSFFSAGKISSFSGTIEAKAQALISKILTALSAGSSPKTGQR